jgi:ABC-type Zn2+ transport system substrate-binding protein/surface adhesin
LLNTREHLESLIEAKQMGVPSIQQFLQSRQSEGHEPHDHEHEHDQAHDGTHDHAHEHAHDHTDDHALNHDVQPLAAAGKLGRK